MNKVVFFRGNNNIITTLAGGKLTVYVNGEKLEKPGAIMRSREWRVIENVLLGDNPEA